VTIEGADAAQTVALRHFGGYLTALAGLSGLAFGESAPAPAEGTEIVTRVFNHLRLHIQMPQADRGAELEKLRKKLAETERQIASIDEKLANESYVSRAPAKVVEDARARRQALDIQWKKVQDTLREMNG
jgi:valyl-tRNA synthetase